MRSRRWRTLSEGHSHEIRRAKACIASNLHLIEQVMRVVPGISRPARTGARVLDWAKPALMAVSAAARRGAEAQRSKLPLARCLS